MKRIVMAVILMSAVLSAQIPWVGDTTAFPCGLKI